jgi:hypothetical protein
MKAWRAKRKRDVAQLAASVVRLRSQLVDKQREIDELTVG